MNKNKQVTDHLINYYHDDICSIFNIYQQIVQPFVAQLEILDGEFPVEILNEIRAILQHILKCHLSDSEDIIEQNLVKANSHLKRAILDCFKYTCLSMDNEYKDFMHRFRGVDLKSINNGSFLGELEDKYQRARCAVIKAKEVESISDDVVNSFTEYELAYNCYVNVHKLISNNEVYAHAAKKQHIVKNFFSFLGWALGIGVTLYSIYITNK